MCLTLKKFTATSHVVLPAFIRCSSNDHDLPSCLRVSSLSVFVYSWCFLLPAPPCSLFLALSSACSPLLPPPLLLYFFVAVSWDDGGTGGPGEQLGYGESQMLDKVLYEEEVRRLILTFEIQFTYAIFYAYMRLREQEIRNLMWISECVAQDQKARITDGIVYLL